MERVLVACPTYVGKEYAMKRWLENVQNFNYPRDCYDVFLVDNSQSTAMYDRWKDKVNMFYIKGNDQLLMRNVTTSMEKIRRHFINGKYDWWANIEIDVIPSKDCLQLLIDEAKAGKGWDLVSHAYPARDKEHIDHQGVGCCIISRFLAGAIRYDIAGDVSPDGWLWGKVRKRTEFKMKDVWNLFPIQHLKD